MIAQGTVTAEHEAAHAIVYLALGYPVTRVSVPDAVTVGPGTLVDLLDNAAISMAGVVVEDRYAFQPLADRITERDSYADDSELDDLTRAGSGLEAYGYQHASALLTLHADAHRRLTDALIDRGELTGEDIAALGLEVAS